MKNRTLYLTIDKKSFDIMITGEKSIEYRRPSSWIFSRLSPTKIYDKILFVNGYGTGRPFFTAKYLSWEIHSGSAVSHEFSNGLLVSVERGTVKIYIGKILKKGNSCLNEKTKI